MNDVVRERHLLSKIMFLESSNSFLTNENYKLKREISKTNYNLERKTSDLNALIEIKNTDFKKKRKQKRTSLENMTKSTLSKNLILIKDNQLKRFNEDIQDLGAKARYIILWPIGSILEPKLEFDSEIENGSLNIETLRSILLFKDETNISNYNYMLMRSMFMEKGIIKKSFPSFEKINEFKNGINKNGTKIFKKSVGYFVDVRQKLTNILTMIVSDLNLNETEENIIHFKICGDGKNYLNYKKLIF